MKNEKMPEHSVAFDILYTRSLDVKESFNKKNELALIDLLGKSEEAISAGYGRTFTSEEMCDFLDDKLDNIEEKLAIEHAEWMCKLKNIKNIGFKTELIQYLWEHEKNDCDPLYFQSWLIVDRVLNIYKRLKYKDISFECNVVSTLLHQKTPYSSEGELPVFEISNDDVTIKLVNSDPISDTWLVLIDMKDASVENSNLSPWFSDMFSEEFQERLMFSLIDDIRISFSNEDKYPGKLKRYVYDDYDLHGLLVTLLSV